MDIESIVKHVPHKRHRTGVKKSRPGTYVQFNYACNADCPRCALESYATSQRELRAQLEKLIAKWRNQNEPVEAFPWNQRMRCSNELSAILEGKV